MTNGCNSEERMSNGTNGDVWEALLGASSKRQAPLRVRKVPAHLAEKSPCHVIAMKAVPLDVIGNAMADKAATLARQLAGADQEDPSAAFAYNRTLKVIKRLAVLQARFWQSREGARLYEPLEQELPQAADLRSTLEGITDVSAKKGHVLAKNGDGYSCSNCRRWRKK